MENKPKKVENEREKVENEMIGIPTKPTYAKFIQEPSCYYIPVFCWIEKECEVIGLVPSSTNDAALIEIQSEQCDLMYGDFQYYLFEDQIEKDMTLTSNFDYHIYPI